MTLKEILQKSGEEFDQKFLQKEVPERAFTYLNQPNIIQDTTQLKSFNSSKITEAYIAGLEEAKIIAQNERNRWTTGAAHLAIDSLSTSLSDLINQAKKK